MALPRRGKVRAGSIRRAVLAYSGGLDSTVLIPILRDNYGYEVIALYVDLGDVIDCGANTQELTSLRNTLQAQALSAGATEFVHVSAAERLVADYVLPCLFANAQYQSGYPVSSALSRPIIVQALVEVARARGAVAIAHGASGKGNDHLRFDLAARAIAPDLRLIAPQRERHMSRDQTLDFAERHRLIISPAAASPYSVDRNLWGRSIQGGEIEDLDAAPPEDAWRWIVAPQDAPDEPEEMVIAFEGGRPTAINGEIMALLPLIRRVHAVAARHGVGRIDVLEDRVTGIKSRELYEAPAASVLIEAHRDLEETVTDRALRTFKQIVDENYSRLVYEGLWHAPLREALDAFIACVQNYVCGEVRVQLYKGTVRVIGRKSPYALYDRGLATHGVGDRFNHRAAEAWTHLEAMPLQMFRALHPQSTPAPLFRDAAGESPEEE